MQGASPIYSRRLFTRAEHKAALWAVILTALVAAGALAFDRLSPPPLGLYGQDVAAAPQDGVLDARPVA